MNPRMVFVACLVTSLCTVAMIYFGFTLAQQTVPQNITVAAELRMTTNMPSLPSEKK